MLTMYSGAILLITVSFLYFNWSFCEAKNDLYTFSVNDIHGDPLDLETFRGKVSLVVNVASECGYTDRHYKELVEIQRLLSYTHKFNVLAFPCNQFGQQEPGTNAEIYDFAQTKYFVNFPMFSKTDVMGKDVSTFWQELIYRNGGVPPSWNFWKYLINHEGELINAWGPEHNPFEITDELRKAVEIAMADEYKDNLKERGHKYADEF